MGRFLLGFALGAALGAAVVIFSARRSGPAVRHLLGDTLRGTLDAARKASAAREQALWSDFHARLEKQEA